MFSILRAVDHEPHAQPLRRRDLDPDPLRQFHAWHEAAAAAGAFHPETVALATATPDGRPSVRFVLLKEAVERGFLFYSGYESRKGLELRSNPQAALCFYWHELGRQVRIEGTVSWLPVADSDAYFATRPYGAQLSAAASRQSEVVTGRRELETMVDELRARCREGAVPRPERWGGFALEPDEYEFWQHRDDRLHDRFRYRLEGDGWTIERLAP
jgi:pyridoxamine 5'-phosphate oxidase